MSHTFRVSGDFALFTRPEFAVERVSYPVMTPSAARGVIEAVLWKPAIRWRILRISVLKPIRFTSVRRNELEGKVTAPKAAVVDRGGAYPVASIEERRQQRNSVILRNVDYLVEARFEMTPHAGPGDNPGKFADMFKRRLRKGQQFHQPYLGCREFLATVREPDGSEQPIADSRDLGLMVWDTDFVETPTKKEASVSWRRGDRIVHGHAHPRLFAASLADGVMEVPADPEASVRAAHGLPPEPGDKGGAS